jgi:Derlin-2/3
VLLALAAAVPALSLFALGSPLIFSILHLYSRNNPNAVVNLWGLIKIRAFYLPFAFCGITLLTGGDVAGDICGILAAHLFYFLTDLYPRATGGRGLATPRFFTNAMASLGVGRPAPPPPRPAGVAAPAAAPLFGGGAGFAAFRGQGRRLAD